MATPKSRKLKVITLTVGGTSVEHQLKTWKINNNTNTGDTTYVFGGNTLDPTQPGAIVEDTEADFTFEGTFLADWASGGISDFVWQHDGETVACVLDHHINEVGEHVRFSFSVKIMASSVGGDANATEETEVSWKIAGAPVLTRIG
ncbi:MAG: hypothetical protein JOY78_05455 [Pseudonocardia sp.]|nr:hypothetical protein [Pseudonocardia sp.]